MATTIHFPHALDDSWPNVIQQFGPSVAVREKWGESWLPYPKLYPLEVTWSVAPTLPVAVLEMDYGSIRQPHRTTDAEGNETFGFETVTKWSATNLIGWFVRIKCETLYAETFTGDVLDSARYWYGVIEEAHDEQGGVDEVTVINEAGLPEQVARCHGRVTLVAYGLEKLLADHQILNSYHDGTKTRFKGVAEAVGIPFDFNRAGPKGIEGNRAPELFGTQYLFANEASTAVTWSTRDIIEHLLEYQIPRDQAGEAKLWWLMDSTARRFACDTDSPLLKCDNATTYSLISQLLDRRRGLTWWVEVDYHADVIDKDPNAFIYIKANSINEHAVVGSKLTIPQNTNLINLEYDADPLTNVVVNSSDLPCYGQVVVRGPRIRCVGTFSVEDGTLEAGWKADDETTYEAGGTPHPADTPIRRKEERNDSVRRAPKLSNVFSLFRIPEDWDFMVGNGEAGHLADPAVPKRPMFIDYENELREQCYIDLAIEQTMPILEGADYSGTGIPSGTAPLPTVNEQEMRPLCFLRRPYKTTEPYKYRPAEGIIAGIERINPKENERIRCYATIPQGTMTVRLDVAGEPQHAIAFTDFAPIVGEDKACGEVDWREAVFTFSIESQFHTQAVWPDPANASDAVRKKVLYAGDQYYQHRVAPNTVVGLDDYGYLIRSDGGWIPTLGDPADPIPYLTDIAKISAAWYTVQHHVLTLETYRLKSATDIPLGALVVSAGGGVADPGHKMTVNSPITQIKFMYPRGSAEKTPAARMQLKTWAGELDAVEFVAVKVPLEPILRKPGERRRAGT
ncbi:MAG: hypothetical protein ACYC6N_06530 [Pirellulaceae bacterium]